MNRTNSTFAAVVAADKRYESFILVMSSKQTLPMELFLNFKGSSDPSHFIFEIKLIMSERGGSDIKFQK